MSETLTPPPAAPSAAPPLSRVLASFLLPLFFVVAFPLAFVSAFHNPTPHDLPLKIVGPAQVVTKIAQGLDETKEFSATQTDVVSQARSSVKDREVNGAILITVNEQSSATAGRPQSDASAQGSRSTASQPSFTVTTYVASGEGLSVSSSVQAAGEEVAKQLGTTSKTVDIAPLAKTDELGTTLFYLVIYTSLGGYLVIIVLMQVAPRARLATRFLVVSAAAVGAPLLAFGLSSIFVGDYGASFGTICALLGVNAIYVFTIGSAAILIEQFLGNAATFGVMAFVVFLNFPSAGGGVPASLLPSFWQWVHNVYFGSGALESFRSLVYFDGHGLTRWLLQLLAWAVGLSLVNFIVYLSKVVIAQGRQLAKLTGVAARQPYLTVETRRIPAALAKETVSSPNAAEVT